MGVRRVGNKKKEESDYIGDELKDLRETKVK